MKILVPVAFLAFLLVVVILLSQAMASPALIAIFESRFGAPGTMHVVPECSCTFKYVDTRVSGAEYFVHFRKMD